MNTTEHSIKRDALIALAIDRSIPLEPRYRLALELDSLLDATVSTKELAIGARCAEAALDSIRDKITQRPGVDNTLERAQANRAVAITAVDSAYPQKFRDLELPPPCLFCKTANITDVLNAPAIGIVGPRNADPYGLEVARLFATDLGVAGLTITSGFARGVDGAAHEAAARNNTPTVAILGCGVDIPYPRQNQKLVDGIIASGGMIISEFPMGTQPAAWRFPIRNRLIAAQTLGMLVVQASMRSGSLISARLALDCGREVYAVPGRIFDQRSRGSNALLQDGAHVALSPQSVLDTLPLAIREELLRQRLGTDGALRRKALLTHLAQRPQTADDLADNLGVPLAAVLSDLTEIELSGEIDRMIGGRFVLAG